jgi:hypothetical protein
MDPPVPANKRSLWLSEYLQLDPGFLAKHLHPVQPGSLANGTTRVLIVDFERNSGLTKSYSFHDGTGNLKELQYVLQTRPSQAHGRLIFVSSVSGVHDNIRNERFRTFSRTEYKTPTSGTAAPILTWPRTAGMPGTHPIKGHTSCLPDPNVLRSLLELNELYTEFLVRSLDQNAHLSYQTQTREQSLAHRPWSPSSRKHINIAVDQANHITALLDQENENAPWTRESHKSCIQPIVLSQTRLIKMSVLILAAEDNCLGIDFNKATSALQQPVRETTATAISAFEVRLFDLGSDDALSVIRHPFSLVSLYSSTLMSVFAAHVELYQRNWSVSYEPYANTSVVYGHAYHRDAVRQLAKRYTTHLRYIHHTLDGLRRLLPGNMDTKSQTHIPALEALTADFEHFSLEISALKANCDQFLEQQVSKLALQDARTSMREARDLKRISYMAFIFVPLSLTSSFFGMNVKELDSGSTPLWVFVVTAIAILLSSLVMVQVLGAKWVDTAGKGISSFFAGIKKELFSHKKARITPPAGATVPFINPYAAVFPPSPTYLMPAYNAAPLPFYPSPSEQLYTVVGPMPPTLPTYADPDEVHYSHEMSSAPARPVTYPG